MSETVANSTHGSTDVLTQASGVETRYLRANTTVLHSVSKPTEEVTGVLLAYKVSTNITTRQLVLPLFHSCELNEEQLFYSYLPIQTLYLTSEQRNNAHAC